MTAQKERRILPITRAWASKITAFIRAKRSPSVTLRYTTKIHRARAREETTLGRWRTK